MMALFDNKYNPPDEQDEDELEEDEEFEDEGNELDTLVDTPAGSGVEEDAPDYEVSHCVNCGEEIEFGDDFCSTQCEKEYDATHPNTPPITESDIQNQSAAGNTPAPDHGRDATSDTPPARMADQKAPKKRPRRGRRTVPRNTKRHPATPSKQKDKKSRKPAKKSVKKTTKKH